MSGFDGNGNYIRYYNWTQDAANGIPITASRFDTEDNGYAAGLSNCITRDGQGKPTTDISWNNHRLTTLADPVNPQDAVTLNFLNGTSGLLTLQSTRFVYAQTAAEAAASVTPVNLYISGDDVDIRRQGVTPASTATQITTAINQILSEGKNCYLPSVNGALTTWNFNGTLSFTSSGQKLYGPRPEQVLLNYTGSANTTLIKNNNTTLRLRNMIQGLRIDAINIDTITAIDWSQMTSGVIEDVVVNLNGNNCVGLYMLAPTTGDRPYWNEFRNLELFSNNIAGTTSGSIGVLCDRTLNGTVTNGGWNGPNANLWKGGRISGWNKKVVQRAGNGNTYDSQGGESNLTNHYEFGVTTADVTGTLTAGAINTFTDSGASWATNNFAGGSIQITGGTGSGQYREIQSNSATGGIVNPYWDTVPDNTSTYAINIIAGQGNAIINCYAEGDVSHNPNFLQIFPSVQSTTLIGGQIGSLGTGAVVTQSLRRPTDRLNPLGWKDPYPVTFGVTALAAAQTNLAIKPLGQTRSQVSPLGTWAVLGVDIEMTGVIAAGTCTIQLLDNGSIMSGTAMILSSTNTSNAGGGSVRQWHFPPQMFQSTGSYHTLGVQVTTNGAWTAGNDLYVTLHVQQR